MYYLKRIAQTLVVFFLAVTVTFVLYRMLPFGPVEIMRVQFMQQYAQGGGSPTPEQMERINQMVEVHTGINPSQPLWKEYINYMSSVFLEGDFGKSIFKSRPVSEMLFSAMPWSIFISVYGLALGTTVSLLLGAVMAYTEGSRFDTGLTVFSIVNTSVPYYIVAIILLIIFAFNLQWFPTGGRITKGTTPGLNYPFIAGLIEHATLPILSSFVAGFGGALAYRGNCIREMGKGYIRVARLRGLSRGRISIRYVGRNALLPVYTSLMMGIASVFGSSIILETIFNYPAMGFVTFNALMNRDYPVIMGAFIFFTTITITGITIADMTYSLIDPRIESGGEDESF